MTATKHWTVDIYIDEHDDDSTRAEARLRTRESTQVKGIGFARRNPHDVNVPEIGDELAAARALADLARRLLQTTAEDIEDLTHESVHLAR
ncbi:MAG TPA: dsRBD fold-containing protein [Jiangellaceae bacterium]|nr:dsRBD fold-containing protein [Jiangellaceae bacterium]